MKSSENILFSSLMNVLFRKDLDLASEASEAWQKHQRYIHRISLFWSLFSGDDIQLWQSQWGWWFCRNLISWFSPILCFGWNFDVDIRHLRIATDCFWKFTDLPSSSILKEVITGKQCHLNSNSIGLNCHASQMSHDISYFQHLPEQRL